MLTGQNCGQSMAQALKKIIVRKNRDSLVSINPPMLADKAYTPVKAKITRKTIIRAGPINRKELS
jgi:hypothetical protein